MQPSMRLSRSGNEVHRCPGYRPGRSGRTGRRPGRGQPRVPSVRSPDAPARTTRSPLRPGTTNGSARPGPGVDCDPL
jgi:hypothetical protein